MNYIEMNLTLDGIVFRAREAGIDSAKVDNGEVLFCESFEVFDDEETNDASRRTATDIQDFLRNAGLIAEDMDSDNDSVWGKIRQRNAQDI